MREKKSKTTLKVQFKLCKYVVEQEIEAPKKTTMIPKTATIFR
jgi:hypothetical protein